MASLFNWFKRGKIATQGTSTPTDLIRRGNDLLDRGELDAARVQYQEALALDPDHADACICLGFVLKEMGQSEAAMPYLERAARLRPDSDDAHYLLGLAAEALGDGETAARHLASAVAIKPAFALGWRDLCRVQFQGGHYAEARDAVERGLAVDPQSPDLHFYLGNLYLHESDPEAAAASYEKTLALDPDHAEAYCNRGLALQRSGRFDDALASLDKAIRLRPDYAEAQFNRGCVCSGMRRFEDALTDFDLAISIRPDYVDARTHRGLALMDLGRLDEAIDAFDRALAINPDQVDAYVNRGHAFFLGNHYPEAIEAYERALALEPNVPFLFGQAMHTRMKMCAWSRFAPDLEQLTHKMRLGENSIQPFAAQALISDPELLRQLAETWAKQTPEQSLETDASQSGSSARIRVGYYSADFCMHPVSFLMAEVFELHDRARFEVIGFAFGRDRQDEMTRRLEAAFDRFIDVRGKTDRQIAELSRELGIDIAIDLGGYTTDARTGIFAYRAAPIQASYIGYLGTMGVPYFDYLLADEIIIPAECQPYYSEKIVYLPSYQANDSKRAISDRVFTRAELGLPEDGFVFCCFNNSFKITPSTFDGWMRILGQVPGSVLLLYAENPSVIPNLQREAECRGIAPGRLVFAGALPRADYLARYRAADLFLDTFPYNAGTTASDALWAGLPVLTLAGTAFASRVAASVLRAIDLSELVATTQSAYEALAVELATTPDRLNQIRERLAENRATARLFDSPRFTRSLEAAYSAMMEQFQNGVAPDNIVIRN
ncbi:tetratricopeptide repeat protein [Parasulfuritortus cantonensis]|uniref:protein O-GlcNAc transferase n=1 Tax=Parasulfuritortus cantonensis TaxID=2528202 RepID=A0A4R1BCI3_9PROT|nr:tetratricopeptide repeat protein [Parasulfuritortus cantonensis]TCJ14733.1 tetratricopeptide repeat protein [Parasulfuritortus cantonensis]